MIAADSCQPHYQTLLITYKKLTKKNAKLLWKEKSECDFIEFKNNRLNYNCNECGKGCFKSINGLIKKFPIVYQFCKDDLNKFVLLLRKGVYHYEDMDSWEKFNETSLPVKKLFTAN